MGSSQGFHPHADLLLACLQHIKATGRLLRCQTHQVANTLHTARWGRQWKGLLESCMLTCAQAQTSYRCNSQGPTWVNSPSLVQYCRCGTSIPSSGCSMSANTSVRAGEQTHEHRWQLVDQTRPDTAASRDQNNGYPN